jgi:hypothetical protein
MAMQTSIRSAPPAGRGQPARRVRYRRWVRATTLGELAGFTIPALVGTAVAAAGVESLAAAGLLVLAGTGEGAVLGWAQSRALRRDLPGLSTAEWIRATAAGAALAWAIGMTPSTFFEVLRTLPPPLLVVLGVLAGLALLSTIGVTQWLVLRCHVEGAGVWVAANVLGWLAGLVVVFVAIGAAPAGSPVLIVAFSVLGGLGMGLTVALVTGAFLVRLLERRF